MTPLTMTAEQETDMRFVAIVGSHPMSLAREVAILARAVAEIDALRAALDAAEKVAADEAAYWDGDVRKQLAASDHVGHGWSSAKADLARRIERQIRARRGTP